MLCKISVMTITDSMFMHYVTLTRKGGSSSVRGSEEALYQDMNFHVP